MRKCLTLSGRGLRGFLQRGGEESMCPEVGASDLRIQEVLLAPHHYRRSEREAQ